MAPIKIKHIVSFSSQDSKNSVENLCDGREDSRPWLNSIQDRSGVLRVELQMERSAYIGFIDVGNCGSAFIQVDVGRSSWSLGHPYVTLLPTATLMNPFDSKQGRCRLNVRMFKRADFLPEAAEESWDRLRVTCTQPFNKHSQFGLSFFRIRTLEDQSEPILKKREDAPENQIPEKITSVMEWLSSPAIQNTFFRQISRESSPESQMNPVGLTRAERMVLAVHSKRHSLPPSPCSSTCSRTSQREESINSPPGTSRTSSDVITSQQAQKRKSAAWQSLINSGLKRPSPTTSSQESSSSNSSENLKSQNQSHLLSSQSSQETYCPLCGESFSPDYLALHASSCLDSEYTDSMDSTHRPFYFGSGADEQTVSCPLCSVPFPPEQIQRHASTCGDP